MSLKFLPLSTYYRRITNRGSDRIRCRQVSSWTISNSYIANIDRQSKDLGSNPSAVESLFFSIERFQILKFKYLCNYYFHQLLSINDIELHEKSMKHICKFRTIMLKNYFLCEGIHCNFHALIVFILWT